MMGKNRKSEIKTLKKLSLENCSVLFDTTVIMHPLGKSRGDFSDIKDKIDFIKDNIGFLVETRQYIERGSNFYITEPVRKEIREGDSYSRSHLERIIRREGQCENKGLLKLRRLIVEKKEEKGRLTESFRNKNKIITFGRNEEEFYNMIFKKYRESGEKIFSTIGDNNPEQISFEKEIYNCVFIKYLEIGEKHDLSYADFDLLMKGLSLSITSNPVILLSNDYSIFYARNDILQEINSRGRKIYNKNFGEEDIGFFNRIGFSEFESLVMKNSH